MKLIEILLGLREGTFATGEKLTIDGIVISVLSQDQFRVVYPDGKSETWHRVAITLPDQTQPLEKHI